MRADSRASLSSFYPFGSSLVPHCLVFAPLLSPASDLKRVRDAHRRIMLANHPDRGGSPYLASKINEAKDILEGKKKA